eukprot:Blabericola_migrator_1__4943@NODE_2578_length_2582_cov_656_772167_g72_i3_p1_GENE_NODE_2578_length_2582_cov_656_772167_g72_i3NODE_2578_length_2582_cov_656_772167_g72_i3_p1_ORF_typecomplete_len231_score25_57Neuroparsin/PF07327_11/0_058_NODE_2578_length_2582_cov_656_772167_g72_i317552447
MSARAASVFVQQALESHRIKVAKHDTSLFVTGVVMAMTNDCSEALGPVEECTRAPFWRKVSECTDYITCEEEECGRYLLAKRIVEREVDTGQLMLVLTPSRVHEIMDLKDLVVICQFLNFEIARGNRTTESDPGNEPWYEWALAEYSALSEEHVWRSPDELTAANRLRKLIAVKLYHASLLEIPQCTQPETTKLWVHYLGLCPPELILEHTKVHERFRRLRTTSATDHVS